MYSFEIWLILPEMSIQKTAMRTVYFSIAGNAVLALIKWLAGFFGNSYALIADAIESTADVVSSCLVLLGLRISSRPPDDNHPYGHGRLEPLITFMVVGFLIMSATIISYQSIQNIQTPHEAPKPFTLVVLAGILIWKELSYRFVMRKSRQTNSSSLRAEAWHHRSDAITSVAAFIGISVALFFGEGFESADDWAALVAAGVILYNSYLIFRPALSEIMDEHLYEELVARIRVVSSRVPGVMGTEKCFVRKSGMRFHVDLHAKVDGTISVREGHDIAHHLKDTLCAELPEIDQVLIHIEPADVS
jgi:cation diffusion facilitator family transporter